MKTIICGGRSYMFGPRDEAYLDMLRATEGISLVIEGGQTGADFCGKHWAIKRGIPWQECEAKWNDLDVPGAVIRKRANGSFYNAAAGPARNLRMAKLAEACVVFPGNKGTRDMEKQARAHNLKMFVAPMFL